LIFAHSHARSLRQHYVVPSWRLFDATGVSVGKLASNLVRYIQGKHKPNYEPSQMNGDYCVVINARYIQFRGENKWRRKKYFHHSGYPGGLKINPAFKQHNKDPTDVLRKAVRGMLPKGRHRYWLCRFLKVYPGPYHPHQDQFKPIDLMNEEERNSAPRLTHLDKQSIPRYIRSDRRFLRPRHQPRLVIDDNVDTPEMKALKDKYLTYVNPLQDKNVDAQRRKGAAFNASLWATEPKQK